MVLNWSLGCVKTSCYAGAKHCFAKSLRRRRLSSGDDHRLAKSARIIAKLSGANMFQHRISRRTALRMLGAIGGLTFVSTGSAADDRSARDAVQILKKIESDARGRLGVFALDTGSGRSFGLNQDSRFAMCSTFKLLLAAVALREADANRLDLNEVIAYSQTDMVPVAPVTSLHLAEGGMSVGELAKATLQTSDNVAGNLLIKRFGGPDGFTKILRGLGDNTTRLDRYETVMNLVPPGEIRDTTTPRAMAETTSRILTGDLLGRSSRATLIEWMIETKTGLTRLRANLPKHWVAGGKTGTALHPSMANKHNDVAIIMPPGRAPIIVAAYFEASGYFNEMRAEDNAVLAAVGSVVADWAVVAQP